jgi:hypothetical protein
MMHRFPRLRKPPLNSCKGVARRDICDVGDNEITVGGTAQLLPVEDEELSKVVYVYFKFKYG